MRPVRFAWSLFLAQAGLFMVKALPKPSARFNPFTALGPGLITGAADDDPSGIATYSQAGAQAGFNLLWTMVLTFPLMAAIQMVSALIGRVTGHGLARNMGEVMPAWLVRSAVALSGSPNSSFAPAHHSFHAPGA